MLCGDQDMLIDDRGAVIEWCGTVIVAHWDGIFVHNGIVIVFTLHSALLKVSSVKNEYGCPNR